MPLTVPNESNYENYVKKTSQKLPIYLKVALLIVATSFLVYSIFWAINGVIWFNSVTQMLLHFRQIPFIASFETLELAMLFVQEYASVANSFIILLCGAFAFQSAVLFIRKNPKYLQKLRLSLVFLAVFSLLLVPASMHHLVGTALSWHMVDVYVGLSYLLQAILIVPPLLMLSQKIKNPQNSTQILKWTTIAAPLFVFALWLKYLFLWIDTLVPMGPKEATIMSTVGAANSSLTLLVAGFATLMVCVPFYRKKTFNTRLAGATLVLVSAFFVIFSIVALFVPIYTSFWYLTDFWMLTLIALGTTMLMKETKTR